MTKSDEKPQRNRVNYINNRQMYDVLVEYKKECARAKRKKKPEPPVPTYLAQAFILIATKVSDRPNFARYSYKDEMILDAVENSIAQIKSFDPAKSTNPFSYYTMISINAFIRRIKKEKKQQDIKAAVLERMYLASPNEFAESVEKTLKPLRKEKIEPSSYHGHIRMKNRMVHTGTKKVKPAKVKKKIVKKAVVKKTKRK